MGKIITVLVVVVLLKMLVMPSANGNSVADSHVAAPSYDFFTLGTLGDPNRPTYAQWRRQRREGTTAIANSLKNVHSTPADFYANNSQSAQDLYRFEVGEKKLHAQARGEALPTTVSFPISVPEQKASWWPTQVQIFDGDEICVEGDVYTEQYQDNGRNIHIGPNGVRVDEIDYHTPFDPKFPMLALLGGVSNDRSDREPYTRFQLTQGCHVYHYNGWLMAVPNQPYFRNGSLPAPGRANSTHGSYSITGISR